MWDLNEKVWKNDFLIEQELIQLQITSSYDELVDLNRDIKFFKREILRHSW